MTIAGRKAACVVMFMFIAGGALPSATRLADSAAPVSDDPQPPTKPPVGTTATGTELSDVWQVDKTPRWADSGRTVVLHGKVLGARDRPIAGARLYLSAEAWTDPVELGTSDANGSYRLAVPEKAFRRYLIGGLHSPRASLIATAEGLGPGWAFLPAVERDGRRVMMKAEYARDFHLAADFPIAGRIVDAGGKPVAGAVIAVDRIFALADPRWEPLLTAIKAGNPGFFRRRQNDPNNWYTPLNRPAWKMIPPATTDSEGRFQIAGIGGDRAIKLHVTGPGVRSTYVSVLTRDDVAEFTQAIRAKYPRTRRPDGNFYPRRKGVSQGDQGVLLFGPFPTIEVDPARTVAGVVRDASTGEPIAGIRVKIATQYAGAVTDSHGRYRILRGEDEPSILVYAMVAHSERYLTVVRQFTDVKGLGEIVADFNMPRGVVVTGRVLESGTDRPIVSGARYDCHHPGPGDLFAGNVFYFPLSTNTALRGTPTGLYFEGFPTGTANYYVSAAIGGDGRFRIAVPPGPGVLFVRASAALPMMAAFGVWKESEGFHRLYPYVTLATRAKDDGAPEGDTRSLPGFNGPIPLYPLTTYHAYRVIDPPADATTLDLTLTVPRAPSRVLRFVGPDGRAIRGVRVQGLLAPPLAMTIVLDGSEAEVLALDAGKPREVIAISNDGKYIARTFVGADNPQPRTIRLEPAGSVCGRLLDASMGFPLADYSASITYTATSWRGPQVTKPVKTDADGRFLIRSLIPGLGASISFKEPLQPAKGLGSAQVYQPDALRGLVLRAGEVRDLGDIRIRLSFDPEASSAPPDNAAQAAPPNQKPRPARDPDDPKFAGHFSGRVTGPDGKPVSRARVFIASRSDSLDGRRTFRAETGVLAVRAETGADGRFEFDAPDMILTDLDGLATRRRCLLIATSGGYGADWIEPRGQTRFSFKRNPINWTDLALQLARDDVPIHGRFLDPDGRPLAGARVRLTGLMIPRQRDLDAHLDREAKISVFAGSPNYERSLYRPPVLPGLTTETRTDADGRFTLSGLGRDRLAVLSVSAPSVVETRLTVMTRDAPDVRIRLGGDFQLPPELPAQVIHGAGFTLQLKPGRTIKGRVIDRASRKPIPAMWVGMLGDSPLNGLKTGEYSRITDAEGRFTITGINPRLLLLEFDDARRQVTAVSQPGLPHQSASVAIEGDSEVLIECPRGIPYRLKLVDEQGRPVEAEVTYVDVQPNPYVARTLIEKRWPISRAAQTANGTFEGFVLPGPGAVRAKIPGRLYRPAHVDPKAFFAPGRTDWTRQELWSAYGNQDTLSTFNQHDYEAIVLVNPPPDSGPLELSATVVRDTPRRVSLIDPDGKPVVGARMPGVTYHPLRAASFPLTRLHPDRVRRVTFIKDDGQLIGFLMARGDGDAPYTVRMRPWGTVTGRLLDQNGEAISGADISIKGNGNAAGGKTDGAGRFRIDKLVPGQRYSAKIYRGGRFVGMAFENLVLRPEEVRDLGAIRIEYRACIPSSLEQLCRRLGPTHRRALDEADTGALKSGSGPAPAT